MNSCSPVGQTSLSRFFILQEKKIGAIKLLNSCLLSMPVSWLYLNNQAAYTFFVILNLIQTIMYIATQCSDTIYCCERKLSLGFPRHWQIAFSAQTLNFFLAFEDQHPQNIPRFRSFSFICTPHINRLCTHLKWRTEFYFRNTLLTLLNKHYGHFCF